MRHRKKILAALLAVALLCGVCLAAMGAGAATDDQKKAEPDQLAQTTVLSAAAPGFSDVSAGAWYAEAANWCRDNGVMNGTSAATFGPDATMTRSMLATVLYRAAGSPAATGGELFTDVQSGAYYTDAVAWASANGIVSGYGNGLFGVNDPVTREQIAAILWRYDGSETVAAAASFTDSASIGSYAVPAVNWAVATGIVTGLTDGSFGPKQSATRSQVAVMLYRYLTANAETPGQPDETPAPSPKPAPSEGGKVLVAYFSATGNTEGIAQHIAGVTGGDLYEIVPETPYTSADLNYSNNDCRANQEQNDPAARPAIDGGVENMADYDVIFLGYPIWWGQAPKIISTFLESYDLDGKTIVPFCTSGSSGIGSSATNLHTLASGADWLSGNRFGGSASRSDVERWVNGLELPVASAA